MKVVRIVLVAVAVLIVVGGSAVSYVLLGGLPVYAPGEIELRVEVTPERVARGRKLGQQLCANCHRDPQARRLSGRRVGDLPALYGDIVSTNITGDRTVGIGAWTDGELAYLLRTGIGRDGRYVPPYMVKLPHMADEDVASIIAFLRSDDELVQAVEVAPPGVSEPSVHTKILARTRWKPLPYPDAPQSMPAVSDKIAHGRYLVAHALACYTCHSQSLETLDPLDPEASPGYLGGDQAIPDLYGEVIYSANITFDGTGLAGWDEEDLVRALREGFTPDDTPLRYPMLPMPELTDEEVSAIYAYLESVPAIAKTVNRDTGSRPDIGAGEEGKRLYYAYYCNSCHADDGVGIADLTHAAEHYASDEELEKWIRDAPSIRPGTRMPKWEGVIRDDEYEPLIAYVRELGRHRGEGR
jgi:mono/diheme cytochrome c family protein